MRRQAHIKAYRKLEKEGDKWSVILYSGLALAMYRHHGMKKTAVTRLVDVTWDAWKECAEDHDSSIIKMCEEITGIEVQNGEGKSWRDLPYLNASLNQRRMSEAQWIYMRRQQIKWIAPQVMACIMISLHRKYHFGFERCGRFYQQVDAIRAEYDNNPDRIREECRQLTGIDVADTTTRKREEKAG